MSQKSIPKTYTNSFDQQFVPQKLLGPSTANIVELISIQQDYQGYSPRHRPPINNADPLSQDQMMP